MYSLHKEINYLSTDIILKTALLVFAPSHLLKSGTKSQLTVNKRRNEIKKIEMIFIKCERSIVIFCIYKGLKIVHRCMDAFFVEISIFLLN